MSVPALPNVVQHSKPGVVRVGVLFSSDPELHTSALRYLLLKLNSLQAHFEYELLPVNLRQTGLAELDEKDCGRLREIIRDVRAPQFLKDFVAGLNEMNKEYGLQEDPPMNYLLITSTRFSDNYYSTRPEFSLTSPYRFSILALGNWKSHMAPPSLAEFILTLTLRESVAFVSDTLCASVHLGTKGCIFDFTASLEEAKFKTLHGFVCEFCRNALVQDGLADLAPSIGTILRKEWLGRRSDPSSAAGILAKLGYDLFVTRGLVPSGWERFRSAIQNEGTKQLIEIVGKVILALLFLYLSIHGIKVKTE
jgi:hypothetical protein